MKNLKRLGIVQPGKIGDIIICLPIAKYYFDRGYDIIWPIHVSYIQHFSSEYINYVNFIPIPIFDCKYAKDVCNSQYSCNNIIDLTITLPNGNSHNTDFFLKQHKLFEANNHCIFFDEIKYNIANVPFSEKWNLVYSINKDNEKTLEEKIRIADNTEYIITHWEGSDCRRQIQLENTKNKSIIEIKPLSKSVFDWTNILRKASALVLIDSCFANLVEQLNLPQRKIFLARSSPRPTLKNKWQII